MGSTGETRHRVHWCNLLRVHRSFAIILAFTLAGCETGSFSRDSSAPAYVREALKYRGSGNVTGFNGPWCRAFVNMAFNKVGHKINDTSLRAIDSLKLGPRISHPVPGAVFVMKHHTGFVWRVTGPTTFESIEGNNQNRVQSVERSTEGLILVLPN